MAEEDLPEHILQEIFLGMPTKPLAQLKCVSNQWNRLTSDPYFMKLRSRRMIFLPTLPFHAIDNNNNVTGATSMIKLSSPFNTKRYKEIKVVGSFNGIVLLVLNCSIPFIHDLVLYNPFSGEFKTVPDNHPPSYGSYVYGFGYGTTADDLKIVRLREYSESFEVFSLKTWSWSRPSVSMGRYVIWGGYSGTFANGFLYWNARRHTEDDNINISPFLILALDIKNMVFSEIEIPHGCNLNHLGTYNGRLCMFCSRSDVEGYEIRVMNDEQYGFGISWSTLCSCTSVLLMGTLGILDDGKLLKFKRSKSKPKLVVYDMFKDSYKKVNALKNFGLTGTLQCVEYVESSISPSDVCSVVV